jgi:hypothetical protein
VVVSDAMNPSVPGMLPVITELSSPNSNSTLWASTLARKLDVVGGSAWVNPDRLLSYQLAHTLDIILVTGPGSSVSL